MGGNIWVESEEDKGSEFIFDLYLPKGKKSQLKKYNDEEPQDERDFSSLKDSKILLVEDNLINQEIIIGLLKESLINIDIANNGQEAIDMFKKNKGYMMILMDLQMPIMDGYKATEIIRSNNQDIPIIALTANAMKEDIERTKEAKMNAHLSKPIEIEKLYNVLFKYISQNKNKSNTISINKKENIDIGKEKLASFKSLDSKVGLSYFSGSSSSYIHILKYFFIQYENIKFNELDKKELERTIHTLKGLSINIGAIKLNKVVIEIEESENKIYLLDILQGELKQILEEIKELKN